MSDFTPHELSKGRCIVGASMGSIAPVYFCVLCSCTPGINNILRSCLIVCPQAVLSRMLLHPNVVITYDCCTGMMDASRLQVSLFMRKTRNFSSSIHQALFVLLLWVACG